jgi:hypothetical protein
MKRIILQEVWLSWRGARDRGGGRQLPLQPNTCRPNIKGWVNKIPYSVFMFPKIHNPKKRNKNTKIKHLMNMEMIY